MKFKQPGEAILFTAAVFSIVVMEAKLISVHTAGLNYKMESTSKSSKGNDDPVSTSSSGRQPSRNRYKRQSCFFYRSF